MTGTKITIHGRITLPRIEGGIDWGTERTVLARVQHDGNPVTDLVCIPGHMVYSQAVKKKVYTANEFMFVKYDDSGAVSSVGLQKGGRIPDVIKSRAADIDQGMGAPVSSHLKAGETVVVELP